MNSPAMKKIPIGLLVFILLSGFPHCKKSQRFFLPPISDQGKNSFGCLVNGQIWVPFYPCNTWSGTSQIVYYFQQKDSSSILPLVFFLKAANSTGGGSSWDFASGSRQADHIYGPGNIIDSLDITYWSTNGELYRNTNFFPGSSSPRYMQITKLDTVNKIFSGIFAFTLYGGTPNSNFFDSVIVTEGRFDLKIGAWSTCTQ